MVLVCATLIVALFGLPGMYLCCILIYSSYTVIIKKKTFAVFSLVQLWMCLASLLPEQDKLSLLPQEESRPVVGGGGGGGACGV